MLVALFFILLLCLKCYLITNYLIFKQNYLYIKYMHRFLEGIKGKYGQYLPVESGTGASGRSKIHISLACTVSLLYSLNLYHVEMLFS